MGNLFNKFWRASREHVGEDVLLSLLDGELSASQTKNVQKHLERCWTCRARRDQLEKTIGSLVGYRKQIVRPYLPPPPRGREMFLAKLDELTKARQQPWYSGTLHTLRRFTPQTMSPIIASSLVVGVAAVLLLLIWQRSLPPVSAHQFLVKAQVWDVQPSTTTPSVVVYQKVEIRTKANRLERVIYRDISGKRRQRAAVLDMTDRAIEQRVALAGVNWQEPLSASSFREWHDSQPVFSDKVTRSGDRLLTLTTSLPSGPIANESLTVRANDFHPINRTIEMRDDDRIEIAELSYAVLGWNEVNEALFEPLHEGAPVVAAIHLPAVLSAEQLDLAELQARLVLNRLNADTTEQLDFSRSNTSVQVKGIVESTQRKNVLVAQLRLVPHVVPAIFSIEELSALRNSTSGGSGVRAYSTVGQPSPLEQFFKVHGRDPDAVSQVSQQLLDAAASVKQESGAIHDLLQRFASDGDLNDSGKAALNELLHSHSTKLQSALDVEERVIADNMTGVNAAHPVSPMPESTPALLLGSGDRNMALCREFITGSDFTPRPAEVIASDLLASSEQLRMMLHSLPSGSKTLPQVPPASPKHE